MDQPKLDVEYPAAGEVLASAHYTFRIGSTEALVEAARWSLRQRVGK